MTRSTETESFAPPSRERFTRPKLLLVDRDSVLRSTCVHMLRPFFDVVVAEGSFEAWLVLSSNSRFDVVLCDLGMRREDGMDLHEKMSADLPQLVEHTVYAVLSGEASLDDLSGLLLGGATVIADRPVTAKTLLSAVCEVAIRNPAAPETIPVGARSQCA